MFEFLAGRINKTELRRLQDDWGNRPWSAFPDFLLHLRGFSQQTMEILQSLVSVDATVAAVSPQQEPPVHIASVARSVEILQRLGAGAMGELFVARDPALRRRFALKRLGPALAGNAQALERFLVEAQVTAQLDHPNIVPVYTLEQDERGATYGMKLVEGKSLRQLIDEESAAFSSSVNRLEIFLRICDAVEFAHSRGVIHRDLKPENVMVGPFHEVYVMDWGLARVLTGATEDGNAVAVNSSAQETSAGMVKGTPRYMAPEQARGERCGPGADQYALGMLLLELLTFELPRRGSSLMEVLGRAANGEAELAALEQARVPAALRAIVAKSLSASSSDRYETVEHFAADIRRYLRAEAVSAHRENMLEKAARLLGRNRERALALLLGSFALTLLLALGTLYAHSQRLIDREQHAQKVTTLLSLTTAQANRIAAHLQTYERRVQTLAVSAAVLLRAGTDAPGATLLTVDDLTLHPPAHLVWSPLFGTPVSSLYPVVQFSGDRTALQPLAERLFSLRHVFRALYLDANAPLPADDAAWQKEVAADQQSLRWTYAATEQGVLFVFPASTSLPADYDARERPWYKEAKDHRSVFWGKPHQDKLGEGPILPCLSPIRDETGAFLGAVGADLSFDYVVDKLVRMPSLPGFKEAFLVNENGKVVVRTGRAPSFAALEDFPLEEARGPLTSRYSGVLELHDGRWVAFSTFRPLDWRLVVLVDSTELGN
jgi:eukaryotic-like serine/threonine-protein kinase